MIFVVHLCVFVRYFVGIVGYFFGYVFGNGSITTFGFEDIEVVFLLFFYKLGCFGDKRGVGG